MTKPKSDKKKKSIESLENIFLETIEGRDGPISADENNQETVFEDQSPSATQSTKENTGNKWQGLEIIVADDAMQVSLRAQKGVLLTARQIVEELAARGIIYGIDKYALAKAEELLEQEGGWQGDLIIARGSLPNQGREITFPFLELVEGKTPEEAVWLIDGVPLISDLKQQLKTRELGNVNGLTNIAVKAVKPGDAVAVVTGKSEETVGKDVFGQKTKTKWLPFEAGDNVRENQGRYESIIYGYIHIEGVEISVLPPLWISPDKMSCYFLTFPQVGTPVYPSSNDIKSLLLFNNINKRCFRNKIISQLCEKLIGGENIPVAVKIAAGFKPKPGKDARLRLHFDAELKAGALREDDSIDLRERDAVKSVAAGDILAEKQTATKGIPGWTLFGDEIPTNDGKDVELKIAQGVAIEEQDGLIVYKAKYDGNIVFKDNILSVMTIFHIEGDVDYETGNIDVGTDLYIKGSVAAGFSVKSGGDVEIKGNVENGACLVVQGNLRVEQGILGNTTKVVVMGNLYASFIQDAEVMVKGDIVVGNYLYNGMVRAAGSVTVLNQLGGKGGRVVGGVVCATKGMEMSIVGSPTNKNTIVALQADPKYVSQLTDITKKITHCTESITKMMRTLHLDTIDPLAVKEKLDTLPAEKRQIFTRILINLNQLIKQKHSLELEAEELKDKMDKSLEKVTIRVSEEFYQGNEVQIGTRKFVPSNDLGPAVFQMVKNKITY